MTYSHRRIIKSLMSQLFQHLVHIRRGRWSLRCGYFGTTMWALRKLSPHKRSWAMLQKLIFQVYLNLIDFVYGLSNDSHFCCHPAEQVAEHNRLMKTCSKRSNETSRSIKTDYREVSICSVVSKLVQRKRPFEITVLSKASEAICGSVVDKPKPTDNVFFFLVSLARSHSVSCLKQRPVTVCQQLIGLPHRNTNQILDM